MKGVATSDLHLGFRAFPSRVREGRNWREQDVELAWQRACDVIVSAQPDLVTIAGDVFHTIKPDFHAVKAFQDGVQRVVADTDAHVIIIGGNHCMPRTAETLTPSVVVAEHPRVHLITTPMRIRLVVESGEEVAVSCFPFVALSSGQKYQLEPDPTADVNVLLLHAAVKESENGDKLPYFYGAEDSLDVGREVDRWDVIACGDYHTVTRLHPTALAFYSGSIERTSSDIWKEAGDTKGVVVYDTDLLDMELSAIQTRAVHDLRLPEAAPNDLSTESAFINAALNNLLNDPLAAEAIVRLKASCARTERDHIDWAAVRQLKQVCFHFQLDLEWYDGTAVEFGDHRARNARTLQEDAEEFFAKETPEVRACAVGYLGMGIA